MGKTEHVTKRNLLPADLDIGKRFLEYPAEEEREELCRVKICMLDG
jgi:hypothetical protein